MADPTDPVDPPAPAEPVPPVEPPADPQLGDAGKAAIKAERDRAAKAERDLKAAQKRLTELEEGNLNEVDRAIKAARDEATAEAMAAVNQRILKSEVKAAAAGKFNDPADALAYLDLTELVDSDGEVDPTAVSAAIDALLEAKPYLGSGAKPPAAPGVPTGARPGTTTPQLTAADIKTMTSDQIVEAKAKGQFNDLLGIK